MSWPQDAYVGQKVVCHNMNGIANSWHRNEPLIVGHIYIIKELNIGAHTGSLYFRVDDGTPRLWDHRHFRPIQSTSTGYAILAKLQNPSNHRVRISEDA